MADYDDDDLDETWEPTRANKGQLPSGLRRYITKLEKENKGNNERLASLEASTRTQTIQTVLAAKGINPKVATFIPADVEATPDAVERWVDDYAEIFNLKPATPTQPATPAVDPRTGLASTLPAPEPSNLYALDAAAQQRMSEANRGAVPVEVAGDLLAKIAAAQSPADMDSLTGHIVHSRVNP